MKKFFVFTILAVMLMSGTAMATQSRITALGRYAAPYICDDYNLFSWYATLPSYSNLMIVEMWNDDFYYDYYGPEFDDIYAYYGLTYGLGDEGKYGTLGLFFTKEMWGPNMYGPDVSDNIGMFSDPWDNWRDASLFSSSLLNKYTMMYGFQMDDMSFGVMFARSSSGYNRDVTDADLYENKTAYTTFGLGARMGFGDNMTADVAFDMTMASYANGDEGTQTVDDGNKSMDFRGRLFYEWSDAITFVPYASFSMADFSRKYEDETMGDYYGSFGGYKSKLFKFGLGMNLNVNEDNMILFAIEPFSYFKAEPSVINDTYEGYEAEVKARTMPRFILALESDITDWLTFRTGVQKSIMKFTMRQADADGNETTWESWGDQWNVFEWNLGLGFHVGDFDIDCVLNKNIPFSMGYWLTGYQYNYDNEVAPIGMVSAVYHF